jgi:type III pantothenate kinase
MTLLTVDAGNSRIKWGTWNGRWTRQDSVPMADIELLARIWQDLPAPQHLIACTVAGPQVGEWLDAWAMRQGLAVRWVTSQAEQCGVRNGYLQPAQLGADRWAALIAARHLVDGAALVVNAGTAVTIDALTREGAFLGGLILPGLELMAQSLSRGTAGLPHVRGAFVPFPQHTADAIGSGAIQAVCGAIERMQRHLAARDAEPTILLSGGAAGTLHAHLGRPASLVPNLVLEGLRAVAASEGAS